VAGLGRRTGSAVVVVVGAVLDRVEVALDSVAAPVEPATVHSLVLGCISFSS
jgi:hypothetical protein